MKNFSFILFTLSVIFLTYSVARFTFNRYSYSINNPRITQENLQEAKQSKNRVGYFTLDSRNIVITIFEETPTILYSPDNIKTIKEHIESTKFELGINGGFFLSNMKYAGLLYLDGQIKSDISLGDSQVTHIVELGKKVKFIDQKIFNFDNINQNYSYFQSGPLIIENNNIKQDLIEKAPNGYKKTFRSFFGIVEETDQKFFVQIINSVDLLESAKIILNFERFRNKKITVINLDGGSSVSFYSKSRPDLNFLVNKKLPMILAI